MIVIYFVKKKKETKTVLLAAVLCNYNASTVQNRFFGGIRL
jgi:hypothetical protein